MQKKNNKNDQETEKLAFIIHNKNKNVDKIYDK